MRISDWSSDVCSSDLLGQLRLADAGGAKEEEAAERPVRVLQARAGTADGGGHGLHGIGLADHALADFLLHLEQLLALALQHLVDWNRSEEHTSELQSLMCISYAVFCLKKKNMHL